MINNIASPRNAAIYGIIFWIALYLISPVTYKYPFSSLSIFLLLSSYVLFFVGFNLGFKVKLLKLPFEKPHEKKWLYYFFFIVSLFSVLFIITDKFVLRGISIGLGAFQNRGILENTPPTIIGVVGNIFKAGVFLSIFLYYQLKVKNRIFILVNYLFLLYFILESFVLGSRSTPVFYGSLAILILLHFGKIKIRLRYLILLVILGIGFFVLLTEVYISRTIEFIGTRERAIEFILMGGSYMDYTILDQDFINYVLSIDSFFIQSFFVGLASFLAYYLHSVVEFSYLLDHFDSSAQMGSHTFFVISKFFKIIFGIYDGRTFDHIPRLGKYTTFFGDIYMDFKYFTLLFMFLFGYWQARLYKTAKLKNCFTLIPLVLFLCILNFIMPVFNLISGGNGIYLIIGFILLSYTYRLLSTITLRINK